MSGAICWAEYRSDGVVAFIRPPTAAELASHLATRPDLVDLLSGLKVAGPWRQVETTPPRWVRPAIWHGGAMAQGDLPCAGDEAARVGLIDSFDVEKEWFAEADSDELHDNYGSEATAKDAADFALKSAGWVVR